MTIEEKLDWILDKVEKGALTNKKENTEELFDRIMMGELYENSEIHTDQGIKNEHEWRQLKQVLINEYKYIELFDGKYVKTVKGKLFIGFQETRKKETRSKRINSLLLWTIPILTLGLLVAEIIKYWHHILWE